MTAVNALLSKLSTHEVLSAIDVAFARQIAALAACTDTRVVLGMALASRQSQKGHVCVDLSELAGSPIADDHGKIVEGERWPEHAEWLAALRASPLVSSGTGATPLVLDARNRLYLQRYWTHEQRVLQEIRARSQAATDELDLALLSRGLERLFPEARDSAELDGQRLAALVALTQRFSVITGGPGTGKTTTVTRLLALLAEQLRARGKRLNASLLAPTGKAAARLTEAVRAAKQSLPLEPEIRDAIAEEASTIHRALGASNTGSVRFRHGKEHPLIADIVVVDESSMIDVGLMRRLLEAVPTNARLVLLGDRNQLSSVEAGAVLGDICGRVGDYEPAWLGRFGALARHTPSAKESSALPSEGSTAEPAIARHVVELTRSYRFRPDRGIAKVSLAVRTGDAAAALREIEAGAESPEVRLIDAERPEAALEALTRLSVEKFLGMVKADDAAAALSLVERFRVLCAHRRGTFGVEGVNEAIEASLREMGAISARGTFYRGRPILIQENHYELGLFNGDVGVIGSDPARGGDLAGFFRAEHGVRSVSTAELPAHETAYAMSIHKSQGSEFDEVAVVLPEPSSPLASRELLYTGLTRARHRAFLVATKASIAVCVERPVRRASGLSAALWPS